MKLEEDIDAGEVASLVRAPLTLAELSRRAFRAFDEARSLVSDVVVTPAVPILYFGDVERFSRSPFRVVTVGLNPSLAEFPSVDPFARFRSAEGLQGLETAEDERRYLAALSGYFGDRPNHDPYESWFRTFEGLLDGMDASFRDFRTNTALHTDICSPVATSPTWSGLARSQRNALIDTGRALWHDLIHLLRPHVILVSVAKAHLQTVNFPPRGDWTELCRIDRENPYVINYRQMYLDDGTTTTMVFGAAAQTPFGKISTEDKRMVGAAVRGLLRA